MSNNAHVRVVKSHTKRFVQEQGIDKKILQADGVFYEKVADKVRNETTKSEKKK